MIVNTYEWSFNKLLTLIKQSMPCVNYLSLDFPYSSMYGQDLSNISLEQIRILSLPNYGIIKGIDPFNWSQLFPCVKRLSVSINSKSEIQYILHQFKNMISALFYINSHYFDRKNKIHITDQWLEKHMNYFREKKIKNFISKIDNKYSFSVCLWINENDEVSQYILSK